MNRARVRDFLLYVGAGVIVVAAAASYGIYAAKTGKQISFKNDWSVTITAAAVGFGYGLKGFWHLRRNPAFWAAWSGLLFAHFIILIPLLSRMEKVSLILGGVSAPADMVAIHWVVSKIVLPKPGRQRGI